MRGGKRERGIFYVSQVCLELTITPNWPRLKAILSTMSTGISLCTTTSSCYLHLFYISIFLSVPSRKFTRQHLCVMRLPSSSKTCGRLEIIELNRFFWVGTFQSLMFKCPSQTTQTTVCHELLSRIHRVLVHCSGWLTSLRTPQRRVKCRWAPHGRLFSGWPAVDFCNGLHLLQKGDLHRLSFMKGESYLSIVMSIVKTNAF